MKPTGIPTNGIQDLRNHKLECQVFSGLLCYADDLKSKTCKGKFPPIYIPWWTGTLALTSLSHKLEEMAPFSVSFGSYFQFTVGNLSTRRSQNRTTSFTFLVYKRCSPARFKVDSPKIVLKKKLNQFTRACDSPLTVVLPALRLVRSPSRSNR